MISVLSIRLTGELYGNIHSCGKIEDNSSENPFDDTIKEVKMIKEFLKSTVKDENKRPL